MYNNRVFPEGSPVPGAVVYDHGVEMGSLRQRTPNRAPGDVTVIPQIRSRPMSAHSMHKTVPLNPGERRVFAPQLMEKRKKAVNRYLPSIQDKLGDSVRIRGGWKGFKQRRRLQWARFKRNMREIGYRLELWRGSFKVIEGYFGSGVVSYFRFLKWLLFLNVMIFFLMFMFVTLPAIGLSSSQSVTGSNITNQATNLSMICSARYQVNVSQDALQLVLDFLQGTGWMEQTVLFYGYYADGHLSLDLLGASGYTYNMPLAYILVTICYFIASLFFMTRYTGKSLREQLVNSEDTSFQYCNMVFGAWDYSLLDESNVRLKHHNLYNELAGDLAEDRHEARRMSRGRGKKCALFLIRLLVNLLVIAMLAASGYLIYYTISESAKLRSTYTDMNRFVQLLVEFMPSLTITLLNVIVPIVFSKIVMLEDFRPAFEIKITLVRTVVLRLASLFVLMASLYTLVTCLPKDDCRVGMSPCTPLQCWETYVGQQLYKLVIMDFISTFFTVFFIEFPRNLIVTKCNCGLSRLIGRQQFVITSNVLDLVYAQSLCWLGAFFAPLIPCICLLKTFLLFYLKKLTCLFNYVPSEKPYKASKTNFFFMIVLIIAFMLCCVPVGYVIWQVAPSRGCGPFRVYNYMYEIINITIDSWPSWLKTIMNVLASAAFIILALIILVLMTYYYYSVAQANKSMVQLMKEQLTLEGRDKQFLLQRINELTGQGPPGRDKHAGKHRRDGADGKKPPPDEPPNDHIDQI